MTLMKMRIRKGKNRGNNNNSTLRGKTRAKIREDVFFYSKQRVACVRNSGEALLVRKKLLPEKQFTFGSSTATVKKKLCVFMFQGQMDGIM